ncbi:GntR family transcriptional regulator [Paracoccus homiensis]|uniref:GntR family transcriptional regulator n=1 Tax=Paracoccus homiensis TaxID=364199 RepID=UPI00398CAC2D
MPVLGGDQIEELRFARLALEPELVRKSAENITPAILDRLSQIDAALNQAIAIGDIQGYMLQNHAFHMQLYGQADYQIVMPLVQALWLRAAPSLRIMCGRFGTQNLPDMHQRALTALRTGNAAAAAQAISDDINQGLDNVRAVLALPAAPDPEI